jgi:hypothetical protein
VSGLSAHAATAKNDSASSHVSTSAGTISRAQLPTQPAIA